VALATPYGAFLFFTPKGLVDTPAAWLGAPVLRSGQSTIVPLVAKITVTPSHRHTVTPATPAHYRIRGGANSCSGKVK
jgi:hypothetical protein